MPPQNLQFQFSSARVRTKHRSQTLNLKSKVVSQTNPKSPKLKPRSDSAKRTQQILISNPTTMNLLILLIIALPYAITDTDINNPKIAESTLVFENHGVILKPQGLIALNSNKQHISMTLYSKKLNYPK